MHAAAQPWQLKTVIREMVPEQHGSAIPLILVMTYLGT
jgi:hypothetical protein